MAWDCPDCLQPRGDIHTCDYKVIEDLTAQRNRYRELACSALVYIARAKVEAAARGRTDVERFCKEWIEEFNND